MQSLWFRDAQPELRLCITNPLCTIKAVRSTHRLNSLNGVGLSLAYTSVMETGFFELVGIVDIAPVYNIMLLHCLTYHTP